MRTLLLLCLIGTMSCMAFGQTYEYLNVADDGDYEIMGMKGGFGYGGYGLGGKGGFGGYGIGGGKGGYGGFGVGPTVTFVQPVVQQAYAPVTLTKNQPAQQVIPTQTKQQPQVVVQPIVQPVIQQAQPIVLPAIQQGKQQQPQQFQIQQAPVAAPTQQKSINYAQPIVTYAQPIVQQLDMTPPKVEKQYLTAQAIVQPTFQTAPVQTTQAITATAPTIQKGYGGSANLGSNLNLAGYGGVGNLAVGGVDY